MKIGVVSDTHSIKIPAQLEEDFKKVDMIIHAGDFSSFKEYTYFSKLKPLKAVYGNTDDAKICEVLPEKNVFKLEKITIGIFHGRGSSSMVLKSVMDEFDGKKIDLVIFGHSHLAFSEKINNTLYFNPGSPNDSITAPFCSYGIIDVKGAEIMAKIVKVK